MRRHFSGISKDSFFATSLRAWLCVLPHLNISCLCGPFLIFQTGKTAFLIAVLNGLLAVVKFLVKKGANKKAEDEVGTVHTLLLLTALS